MWSQSCQVGPQGYGDLSRKLRECREGQVSVDQRVTCVPLYLQSETVDTKYGAVQVTVCGLRSKPGLVTYHDIGLNRESPPP